MGKGEQALRSASLVLQEHGADPIAHKTCRPNWQSDKTADSLAIWPNQASFLVGSKAKTPRKLQKRKGTEFNDGREIKEGTLQCTIIIS